MMLHRHLCRIFDLVDAHFEQFRQGGCRHRAGSTDLCLTATFRAADGCVGAHHIANKSCHRQCPKHIMVGKMVFLLHILQHRRQNTAGAAGRSGDDQAAVCILFADCEGIGADQSIFPGLGTFVNVALVVEELSLSFHGQTTGQCAGFAEAFVDGVLHYLPHLQQKGFDLLPFPLENIVGKADVVGLTMLRDLLKGLFFIDLSLGYGFFSVGADITAANAVKAPSAQLVAIPECDKGHRIGVDRCRCLTIKQDLVSHGI